MATELSKPGMWECYSDSFGGLFCYGCAEQFRKDNNIPDDREEPENAQEFDAYAVRIVYWEYDRDEVCDNCGKACEL